MSEILAAPDIQGRFFLFALPGLLPTSRCDYRQGISISPHFHTYNDEKQAVTDSRISLLQRGVDFITGR